MPKLVQCVPNISEGRDLSIINTMTADLEKIEGVKVLSSEPDYDHNRTVITFVAEHEAAVRAMYSVIKTAAKLIDMNYHKGEHPRIGAVDVAPFIPIGDTTVEECDAMANALAKKVAAELEIPVYMYGLSALIQERQNLANIRRGEFEYLKDNMGSDKSRRPDYGPNRIHPKFGAVAIGVRGQIVNFNININTADLTYGNFVAKKIRSSNGGLAKVKAKAVFLESKGIIQISTVITDYKVTSIRKVVATVKKEISVHGLKILSTELVGLTTEHALNNYLKESLKYSAFGNDKILERQLEKKFYPWEDAIKPLSEAVANPHYMPGGGSVSAVSGVLGISLAVKSLKVSLASKKTTEPQKEGFRKVLEIFKDMNEILEHLAKADAQAYNNYVALYKLPKDSALRKEQMPKAVMESIDIPLEIVEIAHSALVIMSTVKADIIPAIEADFTGAAHFLNSAVHCAAGIIKGNLKLLPAAKRREVEEKLEHLTTELPEPSELKD